MLLRVVAGTGSGGPPASASWCRGPGLRADAVLFVAICVLLCILGEWCGRASWNLPGPIERFANGLWPAGPRSARTGRGESSGVNAARHQALPADGRVVVPYLTAPWGELLTLRQYFRPTIRKGPEPDLPAPGHLQSGPPPPIVGPGRANGGRPAPPGLVRAARSGPRSPRITRRRCCAGGRGR